LSAVGNGSPPNKVAAHWAQKLHNRKLRRFTFLDLGATSGAAPAEDEPDLVDTEQQSRKTFMFPDRRTGKVTKKMLLKHNLRLAAREMNIVPGLHSALVSIQKLSEMGYTTVFNKNGAAIYDDYTTKITATSLPVLESDRCEHTGMWKLDLNPAASLPTPKDQAAPLETINVIFDLPSTRETFLWYHASAGFPTKATFIDAIHNGNYSTWPKLTVTLFNRYFPDSDETIKGHLKGQRQGIRSTKHVSLERIIENKEVRIKIEGEGSPFHQIPITKTHDAFFRIDDLTDSIHTNQTGAFPFTSQQGNRYIMVAIHLDANYIFVEPMRNRTKEEMIRAYKKIINRMRSAGLGIKKHTLDNEASDHSNNTSSNNKYSLNWSPPAITDATKQSAPSRPSKHILSRSWQESTTSFRSPSGAISLNLQNSP
jgi:hypothetical protein